MHRFTLLDSSYSPIEAREVILTLIGDKIRFLNMQSLRIKEMHSGDTSHLQERIAELKKSKKALEQLLNLATEEGKMIELQSEIVVNLVNEKSTAGE